MIELRKFRFIDILIILILSMVWLTLNYQDLNLFLLIFLTTNFMLYLALLIRRIFAIELFFLVSLVLTLILERFNLISEYIIVFFVCGIIFEAIAYFVKESNIGLILASGFSMGLFPFIVLIISGLNKELLMLTLNLSLLCFITGVIATIFGLLIWLRVRGIKKVIEFIYKV